MENQFVSSEVRGRVGIVTLNRPKQLNALNDQLIDEMGKELQTFDSDPRIGAIVVTGGQNVFAAGADIGAMSAWVFMDVYGGDYITRNWEVIKRIRKPIVAAVGGYALGGECELTIMCDIVIAAESARFGQPEIKLGDHSGRGWNTTSAAGGRKSESHGYGLDHAHDECGRSRAVRARIAHRAGRQVDRRLHSHRNPDRGVLPARRYGSERGGQPGIRVVACRRCPFRAPFLSRTFRDTRPERGDARVRRKAKAGFSESLALQFQRCGAGGKSTQHEPLGRHLHKKCQRVLTRRK